ncbi:MAG TPA: 16S rRNA (cytidine(1402)-2'-O)-methyltransferase [Gammaproteobacteria bacterium]|nr:16S rRNA (cytidine(1402)-2'-O)-methyltransferase [Gammaproteobacteria bacterium]
MATPIGNLADKSSRMLSVLSSVDIIVAENPRHTHKLLLDHEVDCEWVKVADATEKKVTNDIFFRIQEGANVALVSDAGTPLVSDPGYRLVRMCREGGVEISPVPGPCAAIAALSVSGMPVHQFKFIGFLSSQSGTRQRQIHQLQWSQVTTILYESPHRIAKLVLELSDILGQDREVFFIREMTKQYEESFFGTASALCDFIHQKKSRLRGEMVVIISPAQELIDLGPLERMAMPCYRVLGLSKASEMLSHGLGLKKRFVYDFIKKKIQ